MRPRSLAPLVSLFFSLPLSAQAVAAYDVFGSGCPGTGTGMGPSHVAPQSFANAFGSSNNVAGFFNTGQRYQQVIVGSEFPTALVFNGIGLRWDNQTFLQISGATIDLEIHVGYTTKTPTTLDTTYANNFDSGAPVTVRARGNVVFPDYPGTPSTDPTQFQVMIPWTTSFAWTPQPGRNLLIEFFQHGSNLGTSLAYVMDAGYSPSIGRVFGPLAQAAGTTDGFAYGYILNLREESQTAVPLLAGGDTPQFGNQVPILLTQARPATVAVLLTGLSSASWNGMALPANLGLLGAPACTLFTSWDFDQWVTVPANGSARGLLQVPNDFSLGGLQFYNQFAILDAGANAFGFAMTNAGHGVIGN